MRAEEDFVFQVEDLSTPAAGELVVVGEGSRRRVAARETAIRCIHGKPLGFSKPPEPRPIYCAACDFEITLLERTPSERP